MKNIYLPLRPELYKIFKEEVRKMSYRQGLVDVLETLDTMEEQVVDAPEPNTNEEEVFDRGYLTCIENLRSEIAELLVLPSDD